MHDDPVDVRGSKILPSPLVPIVPDVLDQFRARALRFLLPIFVRRRGAGTFLEQALLPNWMYAILSTGCAFLRVLDFLEQGYALDWRSP